MARSEIVSYGASLKHALANTYSMHGPHFGRGVAAEYLTQIGAAVSEVEGREIAANLMFRATDAVLADVPLSDVLHASFISADPAEKPRTMTAAQAEEAEWQAKWGNIKVGIKRAAGWWLVGMITYQPVMELLRWLFHW